jgi:hypothetical protein
MNGPLLELIPKEQMTPRQQALLPAIYGGRLPMYKLLREPSHLDDFDWEKNQNAIVWFENETMFCFYKAGSFFEEHNFCFVISHSDDLKKYFLESAVHGESQTNILETITFLWSLPQLKGSKTILATSEHSIDDVDYGFDFASLQPEQIARILDANPSRRFFFERGVWSSAQAVVLASRLDTTDLHLTDAFAFEDHGTAFVRELERRELPFGSLSFDVDESTIPFSRANFERLFELDVLDKLELDALGRKFLPLPFSAKAKALHYKITSDTLKPEDFETLEIVPKDLQIKVYVDVSQKEWEALPVAFLNRAAALGDLKKLSFLIFRRRMDRQPFQAKKVARVANALLRTIKANTKLQYLNVGATIYDNSDNCLNWDSHLHKFFEAVAGHQGLRTFVMGNYPSKDDPENYSLIEQLLASNRNIAVLDCKGNKISNGTTVDKLYALNALYQGSTELVKESASVRPSLVATAILARVLGSFQYISLLLSQHDDILCDLIQGLNLEDIIYSQTMSEEESVVFAHSTESETKKLRTSKEIE